MEEKNDQELLLDGSQGLGFLSYLTIITADPLNGTKETTYELPYALINMKLLLGAVDNNFILGYKIEKLIPKDAPIMRLNLGDLGRQQ